MGRTAAAAAKEGDKQFGKILSYIDDGVAEVEISAELHRMLIGAKELAESTNHEQKCGLTLKLGFVVGVNGQLDVTYGIETKQPKRKFGRSTLFTTPGGNITPENPRQMQFAGLTDLKQRRHYQDVDNDNEEEREAREVEDKPRTPKDV